jgi:hypothetical protein
LARGTSGGAGNGHANENAALQKDKHLTRKHDYTSSDALDYSVFQQTNFISVISSMA